MVWSCSSNGPAAQDESQILFKIKIKQKSIDKQDKWVTGSMLSSGGRITNKLHDKKPNLGTQSHQRHIMLQAIS